MLFSKGDFSLHSHQNAFLFFGDCKLSDYKLSKKEKKPLPRIYIFRKLVQLLFFFIVNWVILKSLIQTDILAEMTQVLPFLHTARGPISGGAGLLEYSLIMIAKGEIPFIFIGLIGLISILTGRFFCGWVCPTGFVCDALADVAGENKRLSIESDKGGKKFKFFLLFVLFLLFIPLGVYLKTDYVKYFDYSEALGDLVNNPVSIFSLSEFLFATIPNVIQQTIDTQAISHLFNKENPSKGIIFIVWCIILGVNVFYPRFYCKYMCPYGAISSLFSDSSLLKLQINDARCVGRKACGICERVCPMQIRILDESSKGFTGDGECIFCLECLEKCPYNAIRIKFGL